MHKRSCVKMSIDQGNILDSRQLQRIMELHLTRVERLILTLYYYEENTYEEIATILDLTVHRVKQIHSSSVNRIRRLPGISSRGLRGMAAGRGYEVEYEELKKIKNTTASQIQHSDIFKKFKELFELRDYIKIVNPTFVVSSDPRHSNFMARFEIQKTLPHKSKVLSNTFDKSANYKFQCAITNNYGNSLNTRCFFGTEVFVCTNGSWWMTANTQSSQKHTINALEDFNSTVWKLSGELDDIYKNVTREFDKLKELDFSSNEEVAHFVAKSFQRGLLSKIDVPKVLNHWNEPEHVEFKDRNGYSLFNAYTSHWRDLDPFLLPSKTLALKSLMDEFRTPARVNCLEQLISI